MSIPIRSIIVGAGLVAGLSAMASAQTTTTSSETKKFEVIAVDGNQLVVALPEGTREIAVPPGFMFTVNGKQLSVQQLKPGMAGTATITRSTTVTPVSATEVKNGTVVQASGASIIVRTDDGFKMFTQGDVDKRGVKIMRGDKPAAVSDFRPGDQLSAVIITSMPPRVVTEQEVNADLDGQRRAPIACHAESRRGRRPGCCRICPGRCGICPGCGGNGAERRGDGTSGPRNGSECRGAYGGAIGRSGFGTRGCCSGLDQRFDGHLLVGGRPPDPGGARPHDAPPFQGLIVAHSYEQAWRVADPGNRDSVKRLPARR